MNDLLRLEPSLREKVWGKRRLQPWFRDSEEPVGEAWFLGDRELPLLVKLIFTSQKLSVQVHPEDGEDGPLGKTEMWHILETEPGATLGLGFTEAITRERLWEASRTGEVEQLVRWWPVKPGETYFTPAHTVHAIGGGIVLCEIQQNSDVTYRLWDYGRPRELHLERGIPIANLEPHPGAAAAKPLGGGREELARCRYFVTELVRLGAGESITPSAEKCQIWIPVAGEARIGAERCKPGEAWLLPQTGTQPEIQADGAARFVRTYVP